MREDYAIIANNIRDIHHFLDEKIKNHPQGRPKWEVSQDKATGKDIIEEIAPLLILAALLEKLSGAGSSVNSQLEEFEQKINATMGVQ